MPKVLIWAFIAVLLGVAVWALGFWLKYRGEPSHDFDAAINPSQVVTDATAPQVIRLWPGKAPGSENWTQHEIEVNVDGGQLVRNLVDPSITAFFPPAGKGNGTSMIVCPGGAFHVLAMGNEGYDVARYLSSQGIAAFVLKYRLTETNIAFMQVMMHRVQTRGGLQPTIDKMTPFFDADIRQSMRVVRSHAGNWGLDPNRIGVIGFSAGGFLVFDLAMHHDADTAPNFLVTVYPLVPKPLTAPAEKIPLLLVCAKDDSLVSPTENSVRAHAVWQAAGIPVEMRLYDRGNHGFGISKLNMPTDTWPELMQSWLRTQGLVGAPK
jgi:acetyl esterase/lipase